MVGSMALFCWARGRMGSCVGASAPHPERNRRVMPCRHCTSFSRSAFLFAAFGDGRLTRTTEASSRRRFAETRALFPNALAS